MSKKRRDEDDFKHDIAAKKNQTSRKEYGERIKAALGKSVAGFIEAGDQLLAAKGPGKGALPHGEFEAMVQEDLGMSPSTARKLMAIAKHSVISNRSHANDLPPHSETLYLLTQVPTPRLEAKLKDGTINPQMERKDVAELLPKKRSTGGGRGRQEQFESDTDLSPEQSEEEQVPPAENSVPDHCLDDPELTPAQKIEARKLAEDFLANIPTDDIERDRQEYIALNQKAVEAERERAQWLSDHPHDPALEEVATPLTIDQHFEAIAVLLQDEPDDVIQPHLNRLLDLIKRVRQERRKAGVPVRAMTKAEEKNAKRGKVAVALVAEALGGKANAALSKTIEEGKKILNEPTASDDGLELSDSLRREQLH